MRSLEANLLPSSRQHCRRQKVVLLALFRSHTQCEPRPCIAGPFEIGDRYQQRECRPTALETYGGGNMQVYLREPPFHLGGAQGFGDRPKYFFHYHPADIYFFPATWSSNYLFHFHFGIISNIS